MRLYRVQSKSHDQKTEEDKKKKNVVNAPKTRPIMIIIIRILHFVHINSRR